MANVDKQYYVNGESDQGYDICNDDCPVCGTPGDLNYEAMRISDQSVYYPWTCESCKSEGQEWHYLEFSGHNVKVENSKENRNEL